MGTIKESLATHHFGGLKGLVIQSDKSRETRYGIMHSFRLVHVAICCQCARGIRAVKMPAPVPVRAGVFKEQLDM